MYILDLEDLYLKAKEYFGARGRCMGISDRDRSVEVVLYGTEVFHLNLPEAPWTSLSFQYEVSSSIKTQRFFDKRLSGIENVKEDIEHAFAVIENFARLRLPDKYLAMWDSPDS